MNNRLFLAVFSFLSLMPSWALGNNSILTNNLSAIGEDSDIYTLTLISSPTDGGWFYNSTLQLAAGERHNVVTNCNQDFVFINWTMGDSVLSTDKSFYFDMPAHDTLIVAHFEYNPVSPVNPNANYWNSQTGEVIIDDFTPGRLGDAISAVISGSNRRDVTMITVAGQMNNNDFGVTYDYSNCTLFDICRVSGISQVPSHAFYDTNFESVFLPASIEKIGFNAFSDCKKLSSLTLFAMMPPTLENNVFENVPEWLVVYVPANALSLYREADVWKDFTILPLSSDVSALEVKLPEGTDISLYKNMYIELINTKSGQKQRYVITDRLSYTFNSLIHRTSYNLYLKNAQGDILGEMDGIDILDQDVSVTFSPLKTPRNMNLKVLTPDGQDVTDQTSITWFDEQGTYLIKGNSLTGRLEGSKAKCHIVLTQLLGMQYLQPVDSLYVVKNENNIRYTLTSIPQTTISGNVVDFNTGHPLNGAVVSVSQMLNGLYSKTFTTKTDSRGEWSLPVYEAKTDISASMTGYMSKSQSFERVAGITPTMELKEVNGTSITLNLTYFTIDGDTLNYYSDYANLAFTVINGTTKQQVTDLSVQLPQIVLMESLPKGTQLSVTVTSKNNQFIPVTATAIVDSSDHANVSLPIKQLGGIKASYVQSDNDSVAGILYDSNNRLVKKYDYTSGVLAIGELTDGNYTLVTMANSRFFNSVANISQFDEIGLIEDVDFVKNKVTVKSGEYVSVTNQVIPFFDESKLYFTGTETSFTANKSVVTVGQYVMLRSHVDFKELYSNEISNLALLIDLPHGCSFVGNSVLIGKNMANHILSEGLLTIPLEDCSDIVKFCIVPIETGDYMPCARVRFTYCGKQITQPIGWGYFKAQSMAIHVPKTTSQSKVIIKGTTLANSRVKVYDNDVFVGETKSLANGKWSGEFELNVSYDCTYHIIRAEIESPDGLVFSTESKGVYYSSTIVEPIAITMFNNFNEVKIDLKNPSSSLLGYTYVPSRDDFTFKVDMNQKHSKDYFSSVDVKVTMTNGSTVVMPAFYDEGKDAWIATSKFSSTNLPVAISANFVSTDSAMAILDESLLNDYVNCYQDVDLNRLFIVADSLGITPDFYMRVDTVEYRIDENENIHYVREFYYKSNLDDTEFRLFNSFISEDITLKDIQRDANDYLCVKDTSGKIYYVKYINTNSCIGVICVDCESLKRVSVLFYNDNSALFGPRQSKKGDVATWVSIIATGAGLIISSPALGVIGLGAGFYSAYDSYKDLKETRDALDTYADCLRDKGLYDSYNSRYDKASTGGIIGNVFGVSSSKNSVLFSIGKAGDKVLKPLAVIGLVSSGASYFSGNEINNLRDDILKNCGEQEPDDPNLKPYIDPSGYVYEAVSSNRIQGVTASCYYKETVEDMYGDLHENIVKWDAAEYAQENPLFTDEYGMYAWDVPQGLWQVKFEKEGYETTYSEWLPVPPPQLDINIAMTQNRQPEVKTARAYEDAVEVEFDKYMMPELLNTENIVVMQAGKPVDGSIILLDEETSYEGETETFASKVRFNAVQPFSEKEVTILVNNRVKSYAGIRMQDNFMQTFSTEQEIKQIVCDSLTTVGYGEYATMLISVLPSSASKGKTLHITNSSPQILGIETETMTIGNDGGVELVVSGQLPGIATLTLSLEGTDKTATAIVKVVKDDYQTVATPTASIASGTVVEKGTKVQLFCATEGATIYYTLDGSCPCDDTDSRMIYDGTHIVINKSITIKAMAVHPDMYESKVAEFVYSVEGDDAIKEVTISNQLRMYPIPVHNDLNIYAGGEIINSVIVSSMDGIIIAEHHKPSTRVTLDLSDLAKGFFIVNVMTEYDSYSRKIIKE